MTASRLSTYSFALRFLAPRYPQIAKILSYPMVKPILDRIDAHPGCIFLILGAPQVFKTLIGQIRALRSLMLESEPALWYEKNTDSAKEVADEKFNPLYDSTMPVEVMTWAKEPQPAIAYADKNKRTKTSYTLPTGHIFRFLSAGVKLNRQGKSAQDIYLNEPWEFGPGWIKDIQSRRADYPRSREIHMMTGPTAGSYSHELWEQSSKEVWHMRCTKPECRQLIPPEFGDGKAPGGVRYDSGPEVRDEKGERILAATRVTVRLLCPHCGTEHPNNDYTRTALNVGGEYVATNPNPERHIFGFRCPAIPLRDWAEIAIEKIVADRSRKRGDMSLTEELHRKRYAETWDPEKFFRTDKHNRYQHFTPTGEKDAEGKAIVVPTPYRMREAWEGVIKDANGRPMLVAKIDVQLDHYYLIIRKWGKFSQSRLHLAVRCLSTSEISQHLTIEGVPAERVVMDSRFDPQQVRRVCALMGWRTMMGDKQQRDYDHPDGLRRIYAPPRYVDAFTGTVLQAQGTGGYVVETLFSKNSALNRLATLRQPDSLAPDGTPLWSAASDAPEWYYEQANAHYLIRVENEDGTYHNVWMGQKNDHAGDCEAMGVVVASALGLTGAESMEAPEKKS